MSATRSPTASRPAAAAVPVGRGAAAVLHGTHPLRGYAVTWHLTPLPAAARGLASFVVERADGHITDPQVWALAEKDVTVMTAHEMCDLVRRVSRHG